MTKAYQMSDLEHNAFIEHCKATETYKETEIITESTKLEEPQGEIALRHFDRWVDSSSNEDIYLGKDANFYWIDKTKKVKVKGYNKNAPHINRKEKKDEK